MHRSRFGQPGSIASESTKRSIGRCAYRDQGLVAGLSGTEEGGYRADFFTNVSVSTPVFHPPTPARCLHAGLWASRGPRWWRRTVTAKHAGRGGALRNNTPTAGSRSRPEHRRYCAKLRLGLHHTSTDCEKKRCCA